MNDFLAGGVYIIYLTTTSNMFGLLFLICWFLRIFLAEKADKIESRLLKSRMENNDLLKPTESEMGKYNEYSVLIKYLDKAAIVFIILYVIISMFNGEHADPEWDNGG